MTYAESAAAVEHPRARFTKQVAPRCPAVVESLQEAADQRFAFLRFARSQWKALAHDGEFRRQTKTQASLPGQDAVLLLLFGLLRSGHMKLRAHAAASTRLALVGDQDLQAVTAAA